MSRYPDIFWECKGTTNIDKSKFSLHLHPQKIEIMNLRHIVCILTVAFACVLPARAEKHVCTFTRIQTLPVTGKVTHGGGRVTLEAPDKLEMIYDDPQGDYLIIDGATLSSCTGKSKMKVNTERNKMFRNLRNTLMNCITGKYEQVAMDNDADFKVEDGSGVRTVTITARKAALTGYARIIIDYGRKNLPLRMVMEEFGGLLTEFQFTY